MPFNFIAAVTIHSDFGAQENSLTTSFFFPSICHEVIGLLSLKPTFSLFFHHHQQAVYSSLLSAIRVVLATYLRLLISLPAILIPACASSGSAFCMMSSAYELNKQGDSIQPCHTPFPILNQLVVPYSVLLLLLDLHTDFSGNT